MSSKRKAADTGAMKVRALRLPDETLTRADALIPWVARIMGGEVQRSDVLRFVLARGLDALEAEAFRQTHGSSRRKRHGTHSTALRR